MENNLVGGFNPFEHIRQNGNLPQAGRENNKYFNHHLLENHAPTLHHLLKVVFLLGVKLAPSTLAPPIPTRLKLGPRKVR